jgi:hypothetical protein
MFLVSVQIRISYPTFKPFRALSNSMQEISGHSQNSVRGRRIRGASDVLNGVAKTHPNELLKPLAQREIYRRSITGSGPESGAGG